LERTKARARCVCVSMAVPTEGSLTTTRPSRSSNHGSFVRSFSESNRVGYMVMGTDAYQMAGGDVTARERPVRDTQLEYA
jgi:hypothetical protein